jgi:DNA-binding NarL/FixJ family response regulator
MASEVLKIGGHGFVAKMDAGSDLLKAVRTVCAGGRFVSQQIVDQGWKQDASGNHETF